MSAVRYYLVTSPKSGSLQLFRTREHADARCALDNIENPVIGPWSVIELAPVEQAVVEKAA